MNSYFKIRNDYKDLKNDEIDVITLEDYNKKYIGIDKGEYTISLELNLLTVLNMTIPLYVAYKVVLLSSRHDNISFIGVVSYLSMVLLICLGLIFSGILLSKWINKEHIMIEEIKSYYTYNKLVLDDNKDFLFIYNLLDSKTNLEEHIYKFVNRGDNFNKLEFLSDISLEYSNLDVRLEHYKNSKGKHLFRSYKEFNNKMIEIDDKFSKYKIELDEKREQEHKIKMLKLDVEESKLDKELEQFLNKH